MKLPFFLALAVRLSGAATTQTVRVRVFDSLNREPLVGVTLQINTTPLSVPLPITGWFS